MDLSKVSIDELVNVLKDVDFVVHEAVQPGVRASWGIGFEDYVRHNVLATQRLLEACIRAGSVERFVFASSSSVYGNLRDAPFREDMYPRPYSPYGVTKLAAEKLCMAYFENYGLPVVILRYFTVYGPRQRPDMAFHRFIRAMLRGEPIRIYGDGSQMRDFTYVGDVVEATVLAVEAGGEVEGEVVNVGSGRPVKLIDAVRAIASITGCEPNVVFEEPRRGDVRITYADTSRAGRLLGWRPKTKLEDGLAEQVRWMRAAMALGLI